jgi:hypothetical protein
VGRIKYEMKGVEKGEGGRREKQWKNRSDGNEDEGDQLLSGDNAATNNAHIFSASQPSSLFPF